MGGNLMGWPTLLIILAVVLLLFGAAKLPALAKSLGQSARVFKGEMKAMKEEDKPDDAATAESTVASETTGATSTAPADTDTPPRAS